MGDGGFGTKGRVGGLKHWGGWGGGKGRKWRNLLGLAVCVLCFNGVGAVHSVCCCCLLLLLLLLPLPLLRGAKFWRVAADSRRVSFRVHHEIVILDSGLLQVSCFFRVFEV